MGAINITKQSRPKALVVQIAIALGLAHSVQAGFVNAQTAPLNLPTTPPDAATKPADAQTPPKAAEAPKIIEEIVVTAQRRPENKQNVSVSVSAITAETLNERNITDLSKMEGMAPGFTFGRSGTDARPAMRGVRTENVAVNGDTTIGFFVDGIYKSRAQQALAGFVDLSRVEIQRGPQGTLYGRNTFGGNISIVTNAPVFNDFQGSASLLYGRFDKVRVEAMLNVPVDPTFAIRFAATVDQAEGYVKNDFNTAANLFDQDLKYVRVSAKFKPDSRFEATVRADYTDQGGNGGSAFGYKQAGTYYDRASCQQLFNASLVILNVRPGNRDGVIDCVRTVGAGAGTGAGAIGTGVDQGIPIYKPGNGYRIDTDYQTSQQTRDQSVSLDMAYRFDPFTLKSITGYADFSTKRSSDSDMSASTIAIDIQKTEAKTFSQELQIISEGSGPLSYVAGYYYFKDRLRGTLYALQLPRTIRSGALAAPLSLAQNGGSFFDDPLAETESNALYAQGTWKLSEQLSFTLGGRYTEDKKNFKFANTNSIAPRNPVTGLPDATLVTIDTPLPPNSAYGTAGVSNCVPARGPGFYCDPANPSILLGGTYDEKTFSKSTGRAAVDYKIAKDRLLYVSYSTGFRSGGFNSGQAVEAVRTFLPEGVKAVELGSKNRFWGGTVQVNAAVFQNQYTNLQEQRQVPIGASTISVIFNAAKAKSKGLELEAEWLATDELSLGGTLSLLDAKYTSFPDVALPFGTSILVADPTRTAATIVNGVTIAPVGQRRVFAPGYSCGVVPGTGGAGQPAVAFGCDLSGNRVPYSPKYSGSLFGSYEIALANGGKVTPAIVATFSSGFYGQPTNAEIEKQGAYVKGDFRVNWEVNKKLSAQFFVDNFTDKQTINRFVWGGGGALQVSVAPPRTWGLKVTYKTF